MELTRDGGCSPDAGHPNCVKRMRHISVHLFLEEIIATCWNKMEIANDAFRGAKNSSRNEALCKERNVFRPVSELRA